MPLTRLEVRECVESVRMAFYVQAFDSFIYTQSMQIEKSQWTGCRSKKCDFYSTVRRKYICDDII